MKKNNQQMNIYSEEKKEEKKHNNSSCEIEKISYNLHIQILEKFLHSMAGKMNICNLLFDIHPDNKEVKKVFNVMESILILYRGILLNRSGIKIPQYVFTQIVEDKEAKCIINDLDSSVEEKAFLIIVLYNSISQTTEITINKHNMI